MNIESNQSVTSQPSMSESQIEDVTSSTWKYIRTQYASYIIIYICICFVVIYLIPNQFTIYLLIMIAFWGYSVASKKVKSEFTKEFGKSIGFTYGEDTSPETVVGKLFKTGHSQSLSDVLTGVYKDIPIRIFTFCFTIGYGKNSHTYLYTVFEATLLGKVPDILLFSNKHTSAVTDWFSGDETIILEGDFNKYFKLRVPKGYEQEAYEIFTPDVMTQLIDRASDLSFEFVANKLYIYATKVITKRDDMKNIFDLSEYLIGLFNKNTANIDIMSATHAN